jgi:hypothetical protein
MFLAEKVDIKKNNNLWPVPNCNFCDPNIPKDLPSVNEADYASWESDVIIENYPNPFRSKTGILVHHA